MQMELARANRVATMGQLTASIAHEINQPIASAVTSAQAALRWLRAEPPDLEALGRALDRIVRDSNRAGGIVHRIRALIRKASPRMEGLAINDAILEIVALTHSEVAKRSITLRTQLAEGLPDIQGHRGQLQQVVLHLIVNAIEAMSQTSDGTHDLFIGSAPDGADGVQVTVCDSRARFRPWYPRACLGPLLHHKSHRAGHGPVDLPLDHRGARGMIMGRDERIAGCGLSIHGAGEKRC
jgi:C4-dicarboxylate-specific signal transduction histidine kinase